MFDYMPLILIIAGAVGLAIAWPPMIFLYMIAVAAYIADKR